MDLQDCRRTKQNASGPEDVELPLVLEKGTTYFAKVQVMPSDKRRPLRGLRELSEHLRFKPVRRLRGAAPQSHAAGACVGATAAPEPVPGQATFRAVQQRPQLRWR